MLLGGISFFHYYTKSNKLEDELMVSTQNTKALKDVLRTNKDRVGTLEYSKSVLISNNKELGELNADLSNELKKVKGDVYELTILNGVIKSDTIRITDNTINVENDSTYNIEWEYNKKFNNDNRRYLKGQTRFTLSNKNNHFEFKPMNTLILNDEIHLKITQGIREKDGKLEVFAKSDYPGFELADINSVIIDPQKNPVFKKYNKKSKFNFSIYVGYGITYDFKSNKALDGVQGGIGWSYSPF